jgi:hypothetical protein
MSANNCKLFSSSLQTKQGAYRCISDIALQSRRRSHFLFLLWLWRRGAAWHEVRA